MYGNYGGAAGQFSVVTPRDPRMNSHAGVRSAAVSFANVGHFVPPEITAPVPEPNPNLTSNSSMHRYESVSREADFAPDL